MLTANPPRTAVRGRPPAAAAVGVAVLTGAAALVLAVRDPNESGSYPLCPTRALTGLDCPGCGALRAVHALVTGDPVRAAGHNLLLVAALPLALFHYVLWARPSVADSRWARRVLHGLGRPAVGWGVVATIVVFTVVRNLSGGPWAGLHS